MYISEIVRIMMISLEFCLIYGSQSRRINKFVKLPSIKQFQQVLEAIGFKHLFFQRNCIYAPVKITTRPESLLSLPTCDH